MYTLNETHKFPIAYRFENERKDPYYLLDNITYVRAELVKTKRDPNTGQMVVYDNSGGSNNNNVFPQKKCTYEMLGNDSVLNDTLTGWWCLDLSALNFTVGGFYDSATEYIHYLRMRVFFCDYRDGRTYKNCTPFEVINALLNAPVKVYFSINIPKLSVAPERAFKPLTVGLQNIFGTMNPLMAKTDRYFYRKIEVKQDTGWLWSDKKTYTNFDVERRDTDIQIRSLSDYNNPAYSKTLYTIIGYVGRSVTYYDVVFIKIQFVLANVGGIFKIVTMIVYFVMYFLQSKLRTEELINRVFDFGQFSRQMELDKDQSSQLLSIENQNQNKNSSKVLKSKKEDDQKGGTNILTTNVEMIILNENVRKKSEKEKLKPTQENAKILKSNNFLLILDLEGDNQTQILQSNQFASEESEKLKVGFCLMMKNTCCYKKVTSSEKFLLTLYYHSADILDERLDVVHYLKLIQEFNKVKSLTFKHEEENLAVSYLKKEKVMYNIDYDSKIYDDVKKIKDFYAKASQNPESNTQLNLSGLDFQTIDDVLKAREVKEQR